MRSLQQQMRGGARVTQAAPVVGGACRHHTRPAPLNADFYVLVQTVMIILGVLSYYHLNTVILLFVLIYIYILVTLNHTRAFIYATVSINGFVVRIHSIVLI